MCVLIFPTTVVLNISCSKKNSAGYYPKFKLIFMKIIRYSYQTSMELEFSREIFEKFSRYKISWKCVQRGPSCSPGADGHEKASSTF